jgi:hypothetical protein
MIRSRMIACLILLGCCGAGFAADDQVGKNTTMRATLILGMEGISNNASGDLSIQGDSLRFHKTDGPSAEIAVSSIQNVFLGEEEKQVGGVPLEVGKAAAPFGGGRVVSLFSHKNYDTVTLQYVDANGGFHGAIFQLNKGQGQALKDQLTSRSGAQK